MPGMMKIQISGVTVATTRYETANGRKAILSLYNALYNAKEYTLTIIPDECADTESAGISSQEGAYSADLRRHHLRGDDNPHRSFLA